MKRNLLIVVGFTSLVLVIVLLDLIIQGPYRSRIPEVPESENVPILQSHQIKSASRKAHLYPTARNLGTLGMIYYSNVYYEKAAECYSLASRKDSSDWIWNYYLGCLNKEMGESEKAIANFRAVVKSNPLAYNAWYYLGEIYLDLGQHNQAEDALSKISYIFKETIPSNQVFRIDHFPIGTYASYLLSKAELVNNETEISEKTLTELLVHSPNFGPAYRLLGNIYQAKGDSITADFYIHQANDNMYPTFPADTLLDMIALLSRSDQYILKQIDESDYYFYYDWALTLADRGMVYIPDNKYLISKTIKILLKTGKGEKALPILDKHFEEFKDDTEELKQVADLLYEKEYYTQSGNYYNRILELKPDSKEVTGNLILGLLNQGEGQKAMALMNGFLKTFNYDQQVLANAVYIMILLNKQAEADDFLKKLADIAPDGTKTLLLSGYIAQQKGDINRARQFFERSFNNDPKELLAAQSLGEILIRQKLWKKSIEHYKLALDYFPNELSLIETLGSLYITCPDSTLRDYRQGVRYLERLMVNRASSPELKIFAGRSLAHAYNYLGDKARADYYISYALNMAQVYGFSGNIVNELQDLLKSSKSRGKP